MYVFSVSEYDGSTPRYGRMSAIILPTVGAAIWPPLMEMPVLLLGVSSSTRITICGSSAGAKPMNETMYSFAPPAASCATFSDVPVLPPMR